MSKKVFRDRLIFSFFCSLEPFNVSKLIVCTQLTFQQKYYYLRHLQNFFSVKNIEFLKTFKLLYYILSHILFSSGLKVSEISSPKSLQLFRQFLSTTVNPVKINFTFVILVTKSSFQFLFYMENRELFLTLLNL